MIATDFIYDGQRLTDLGYMICQFDEGSSFATSSAGSQLTFTKVAQGCGRSHLLAGAHYDECFETDISICKADGSTCSALEYAALLRWLNRPSFHELTICMEDGEAYDYDNIHFKGTFNVDKVEFRGRIIGFTLHFTSDGPFGYGEPVTKTFSVTTSTPYSFSDTSDEVGYIYPDSLTITCLGSGTLSLTNSIEGRTTTVKNVVTNEVLTFDNTVATVTSSVFGHNVMNDFNYTFFRVANLYATRVNMISSTINCSVVLTYTPRRKVVF